MATQRGELLRRVAPEMSTRGEQTTVARPVSKEGVGLHTGERCAARLWPAGADSGIVFACWPSGELLATAGNVVDTERGTSLGCGETRVGGVEHLMAALYGMGVDNVRVEVDGPEVPACDGSAREWVELLKLAGRSRLGVARQLGRLGEAVWLEAAGSWAMAAPARGGPSLAVEVDYERAVVGKQRLWMRLTRRRFMRELAPARTFVDTRDLEALQARGLARGGGQENAFAFGPEGYSGPLRFPDEVVRHKALDLVGDLALCGWRFEVLVVAVQPSHKLNVALALALRAAFRGDRARLRRASPRAG